MSSTDIKTNLMSVGQQSPLRPDSPSSNSSQARRNRKRTSPEASVSLRHGIASASAAEPNKAFAIPPKLLHGDPTRNRGSPSSSHKRKQFSGGQNQQSHDSGIGGDEQQAQAIMRDVDQESAFNSNGSHDRSVPEDWFKNLNTNVGDFNKPNVADGDSPYYLPSERQRRKQKHQTNQTVRIEVPGSGGFPLGSQPADLIRSVPYLNPSFPPMIPTQDSEDESDVYRSVIDDLTIKNKKLKKKLRKMERLHCNELNEEKLFEVRCYGLPPTRKQELQELLQKFAAGLENNGGVYEAKRSDAVSNANATSSTNPSSSSLLQNTDSAYATDTRMTSLDGVSGFVDAAKSQVPAIGQSFKDKPKGSLSTTSLGLDARPIQFASERARMKLVVRRLEQLFTGSDGLQSDMEKSKVQQQVAVAAAAEKHDTAVDEMLAESGDEDDRREANMMSHQQDDDLTKEKNQDIRSIFDTSHQRPTRPMDLDPNRAQVASDNVEYLEQMSFPPHKHHRPVPAGEFTGWVYLNLLNNMAQVHTLNVSLSFIKKAIRQFSDKLELSPDGNKVRWRGGLIGTRLSSEGENSSGQGDSSTGGESSPGEGSSDLKSKSNPTPDDKTGVNATSTKDAKSRLSPKSSTIRTPGADAGADNFRYRPLVFHNLSPQKSSSAESSEQENSDSGSEADDGGSGGPPPILESSSNVGIGDIVKFAPIDGSIIYFGGAPFCTDLSAQVVFREGGHTFLRNGDSKNYNRFVEEPIGPTSAEETAEDGSENQHTLSKFDWSTHDVEMDLSDEVEENLPELTSIMSTSADILPSAMPAPLPFEVSGIGGVRSEDNFVVYVKTIQKPVRSRKYRIRKSEKIFHSIPAEILKSFHDELAAESKNVEFENEVMDSTHIRLLPSKLPDPVFAFSLSEDSSDPFASTDEPRSYESHLSFAYNIESDSRSSGEGIPSFHSPDLGDESPMDLDAEEGIVLDGNPLAPLSVIATAGDSQDGSAPGSPKDAHILKSLDDMDIGSADNLML